MARTAAPGCRGQVGRTLGRERLWVAGYNNPDWNRTCHFGYDGDVRIQTVERVVRRPAASSRPSCGIAVGIAMNLDA